MCCIDPSSLCLRDTRDPQSPEGGDGSARRVAGWREALLAKDGRPDGIWVHEEGFDSLSGRRGMGIR